MTKIKMIENNIIKTKNKGYAIEKDPVKILGKNFRLQISYKNIKISELNLIGRDIQVFLPNKFKKIGNIKILNLALDKMYKAIAKEEIEKIMEKTRITLNGLAPEDYEFKNIPGVLAYCSEDKRIIINPEIVKFDKKIIEYVIMHEFCHLKYKTHCRKFYELIQKHIPEYHTYEKELIGFKF